ncbi:MAG TPA: ABC transporter permease [Myxococcales bacterium]|nr:ABC transporter permease [Myxococcales bacterium]
MAQPEVKRFLARRVLAMTATILGVTLVAFVVARAAPGDPVAVQGDLGLRAGSASIQQLREYRRLMGLDEPILAGYLRWLWHLLRGDLGTSFRDGRPVLSLLGEALPVTLLLSIPSLLIGYLLAVPVGIVSAARPGGWLDRSLATLAFILHSLPLQWVALVLVVWPGGFPIQGLHSEGTTSLPDLLAHLVLPVVCLSYGSVAVISRFLRSSMLEEMRQDYVRTARAKGLSEAAVILRHALPNSLLSLITLFGLTFPALASGAVIVERIFGLPGMGKLTFEAVLGRDVPVVMGAVALGGVATALGTLLSDLLYAAADPRISLEEARAAR